MVDEYFSIYLSHGLSVGGRTPAEDSLYRKMQASDIPKINTIQNIYQNTIRDGGNGLFYYFSSHYLCLVFAKYIGILHTLRLFNVLLSFSTLLLIFFFCKKYFSLNTAVIASLIYVFVCSEYGLFIRTYMLSTFLTFVFFLILIKNEGVSKKIFIFITSILMLFSHFFCIFPLIGGSIWQLGLDIYQKNSIKTIFRNLLPMFLAFIFFFTWYFLENKEGRKWQNKLSEWRKEVAQQWGTDKGINWIIPTKPNLILSENTEWWLYYTNLDLRNMNNKIRLSFLFPLLLLVPISVWAFRKRIFSNRNISLILLLVLLHWGALNILAIISGHLTSLEYKFYGFIIFPFIAILIGIGFNFASLFVKKILIVFYLLIGFNFAYNITTINILRQETELANWQMENEKIFEKIEKSYNVQKNE